MLRSMKNTTLSETALEMLRSYSDDGASKNHREWILCFTKSF